MSSHFRMLYRVLSIFVDDTAGKSACPRSIPFFLLLGMTLRTLRQLSPNHYLIVPNGILDLSLFLFTYPSSVASEKAGHLTAIEVFTLISRPIFPINLTEFISLIV